LGCVITISGTGIERDINSPNSLYELAVVENCTFARITGTISFKLVIIIIIIYLRTQAVNHISKRERKI